MTYEKVSDWFNAYPPARPLDHEETCVRCGERDKFVTSKSKAGRLHYWCVGFGESYEDSTTTDFNLTDEQNKQLGECVAMQVQRYLANMQHRVNWLQWNLDKARR